MGSNPVRVTILVSANSDEDPPVPIPNTEVKLISVENTWRVTAWENRAVLTQPEFIRLRYSSLAQSVEHAAVNRRVVCSSQTGGAKHLLGWFICSRSIPGANKKEIRAFSSVG